MLSVFISNSIYYKIFDFSLISIVKVYKNTITLGVKHNPTTIIK